MPIAYKRQGVYFPHLFIDKLGFIDTIVLIDTIGFVDTIGIY